MVSCAGRKAVLRGHGDCLLPAGRWHAGGEGPEAELPACSSHGFRKGDALPTHHQGPPTAQSRRNRAQRAGPHSFSLKVTLSFTFPPAAIRGVSRSSQHTATAWAWKTGLGQ